MQVRQINEEYAVSPQITLEDLEDLKRMGFASVVCHRPDDEDPGQPSFSSISARARELGMEAMHIPVVGQPSPDSVREMVDALDQLPKPMLGYCRSGNRSGIIYQMTLHLR